MDIVHGLQTPDCNNNPRKPVFLRDSRTLFSSFILQFHDVAERLSQKVIYVIDFRNGALTFFAKGFLEFKLSNCESLTRVMIDVE